MQEVFMRGGRPIKSWASEIESGALDQAANLSKLPFAMKQIALMPDAHAGYGMPIGGVFMADKAVVPYAIGVDIGCGVSFVQTDIRASELTREKLQEVATAIEQSIPTGQRSHPPASVGYQAAEDAIAERLQRTLSPNGYAKAIDLFEWDAEFCTIFVDAVDQLGTLGSGNHFIELQTAEREGGGDNWVYIMIHSGSRSYGKKVCDTAHETALSLNERWYSALPHKELAYLPAGTPEFEQYWNRMQVGLAFAEENRSRMMTQVISVLMDKTNLGTTHQVLDVHHNYAAWENHFNQNGIVHRKGAVRAREGELVAIPGSMGTASYIASGLGNPESFNTCQHGAGRARSRAATRRITTLADMEAQLGDVVLATRVREDVIDESPLAYKDVEEVMRQSADLVEPVMKLRPLAVVKGSEPQRRKKNA